MRIKLYHFLADLPALEKLAGTISGVEGIVLSPISQLSPKPCPNEGVARSLAFITFPDNPLHSRLIVLALGLLTNCDPIATYDLEVGAGSLRSRVPPTYMLTVQSQMEWAACHRAEATLELRRLTQVLKEA